MPWTRLDDLFAQHPKMRQAGPLGLALQVAALCYCNQYLTDGFVPVQVVDGLQRFDNIDLVDDDGHATRMSTELVVDMLVDAGAWEPAEGGWRIHDYTAYQLSRKQVLAERKRSRLRQSQHRKSRRDKQRDSQGDTGVTNADVTGDSAVTNADVTEKFFGPVPVLPKGSKGTARRPNLDDDAPPPTGSIVDPGQPKTGFDCPVCGIHKKTQQQLVDHLEHVEGWSRERAEHVHGRVTA